MGFVAGGPGGFQLIEDISHATEFYDLSGFYPDPGGYVVNIGTADLDRTGSMDLGLIMHEDLLFQSDEDRVFFFINTDLDSCWCPLVSRDYAFDPIDACVDCDTLWVPLTPRFDFPITINSVRVDPPFSLVEPLPPPPVTLLLGDTLQVGVIFCADSSITIPFVQGDLTVETTGGICAASIRAEINFPDITFNPDPMVFSNILTGSTEWRIFLRPTT